MIAMNHALAPLLTACSFRSPVIVSIFGTIENAKLRLLYFILQLEMQQRDSYEVMNDFQTGLLFFYFNTSNYNISSNSVVTDLVFQVACERKSMKMAISIIMQHTVKIFHWSFSQCF
mmetsp:Transcript_4217/g.5474  ORF Transcript_4217/g.5474 Transcript_4217/m.5474 type:complete len:117 (-) Transcript_4217:1005-1355(-)